MAYTILGQGKSHHEAEIDAICELGDFWNFNVDYFKSIVEKQPFSPFGYSNESVYNPLHGFVAAITPFNFTAIGGNLATVPLFFKNVTIWKPSSNAVLSNYLVYKIMLEAGMPEEAIAFTPCDPILFSNEILSSPDLGGVLFTEAPPFSIIYFLEYILMYHITNRIQGLSVKQGVKTGTFSIILLNIVTLNKLLKKRFRVRLVIVVKNVRRVQ